MRHRLRKPAVYQVLAVCAAALVLGRVAYAAIPGEDGTIKGCYATSNGVLLGIPHSKGDARIVDEAASCRSYEKPLSWNQKGVPGEAGEPGSAAAYATIAANGELVAGTSKNITDANIAKGIAGNYCLTGLPFTARSAVVSAEGANPSGPHHPDVIATTFVAAGTVGGASVGCSAKVLVRTYDASDASLQDRAFTVWIED